MRLLRVQVPEFRALKDVDISFEPDFTPQVFPLGSLNGGGKSTLLQLIFVSLYYFSNLNRVSYLINMLSDILPEIKSNDDIYSVITITLLLNDEIFNLQFFCTYNANKAINIFNSNNVESLSVGTENGSLNFYVVTKKTDAQKISNLKQEIAKKLFLISPSNQPYLFLSLNAKNDLFTVGHKNQYNAEVQQFSNSLPNFFTFDTGNLLTDIFRLARDKDYRDRNKENPFSHSEKLEEDINTLFTDGKKIQALTIDQQRHYQDAIQTVTFKLISGKIIYPKDLSDGELKRLTIFALIKYYEIQDAIVLIDEIENSFHPRWQRYIVDDLVEWGASNQYILATHSYEVCRNLPFEHIKELSPRLFSENQE